MSILLWSVLLNNMESTIAELTILVISHGIFVTEYGSIKYFLKDMQSS